MNYDKKILEQFAKRLNNKADAIVTISVIVGLLIGGIIMSFQEGPWGGIEFNVDFGSGIGAMIGAGIGYWIGSERAFWYRLRAQQTLCQKQIEENTADALVAFSKLPVSKQIQIKEVTSKPIVKLAIRRQVN